MDALLELEPVLYDAHTGRRRTRRPHHRWEHRYRRRARRYGFTPVVVTFTAEELHEAYGSACWWCGKHAEEIDHVIAVRDGGEHTLANVRPTCHDCNVAREILAARSRPLHLIPGQLSLALE